MRLPISPRPHDWASSHTGTARASLAVDAVEAVLIAAAREGAQLTYAEALALLGHRFTRPLMRHLCVVLNEVDARQRGADAPELAALVVRQSDGLPGQGWWSARTDWPGAWTGPAARAFITAEQRRAFAWHARRGGADL